MSGPDIRRADDGIRWPPAKECAQLRAAEGTPECICRTYDGMDGYYLVDDATRHAFAYYKNRADAVRRLTHARPDADARPVPGPVPPVCGPVGGRPGPSGELPGLFRE
jgi:hypothetical protein